MGTSSPAFIDVMRALTISGGGTLRRRMATSCIIVTPAPAVLAEIQSPIGTMERMMKNTTRAASPPTTTKICPKSIGSPCCRSDWRDHDARAFHHHHPHRAPRLDEPAVGHHVDALPVDLGHA